MKVIYAFFLKSNCKDYILKRKLNASLLYWSSTFFLILNLEIHNFYTEDNE